MKQIKWHHETFDVIVRGNGDIGIDIVFYGEMDNTVQVLSTGINVSVEEAQELIEMLQHAIEINSED